MNYKVFCNSPADFGIKLTGRPIGNYPKDGYEVVKSFTQAKKLLRAKMYELIDFWKKELMYNRAMVKSDIVK